MIIAILEVNKGVTGRHYNTKSEVQAQLGRGDKTADGKIIAGLGTAYPDEATMLRDKALDKQCNALRASFKDRFVLAGFWDSTFVLSEFGEAQKFVDEYRKANNIDPQIQVNILEGTFELPANSAPAIAISNWEATIKAQVCAVRLGRKYSEGIESKALAVFDALAKCPALSAETANELTKMAAQYRQGHIDRDEFERVRETLNVKVNMEALGTPTRVMESIRKIVPTEGQEYKRI